MVGEVRALNPGKKPSDASIQRRLRVVEGDMAALKHAFDSDREERALARAATHTLLGTISDRLGKPPEGPEPATGIYFAIDAVSERVRPFEAMWLQVKGGAKAVAVIIVPVGFLIWFLAGPELTRLFQH